MTAPQLVLAHGWGCGPDIWRPVLSALDWPSASLLDFGYFGGGQENAACLSENVCRAAQPVLAVGHSLGFLWLLSQQGWPEGTVFLGINAFGRFVGETDFPNGVPPRVLARMQAGLQRDAAQVVTQFRARCGLGPVLADVLCESALQDGLKDLMTLDVRPALSCLVQQTGAVKILAGMQDPIVSPDMTLASFPQGTPIEWQGDGGHMLPRTHPSLCADFIRSMMVQMLENS